MAEATVEATAAAVLMAAAKGSAARGSLDGGGEGVGSTGN